MKKTKGKKVGKYHVLMSIDSGEVMHSPWLCRTDAIDLAKLMNRIEFHRIGSARYDSGSGNYYYVKKANT